MNVPVLHSYAHWLPLTMNWLHNQVRFLDDDITSHVFCDVKENEDAFPTENITCLNDGWPGAIVINKLIRKSGLGKWNFPLKKILTQKNTRVLHSHFGHTGWENMRLAKHCNIPHVVTFYGADVNFLPKNNPAWFTRYHNLFDLADLFLCEGPFMRESLIAMGCPPSKVLVHHLGVDVSEIAYNPVIPAENEPIKILIAASFREKKGIPYALEALLACKNIPFEITIVGGAAADRNSTLESEKIHNLAKKLGDRVHFAGFLSYQKLREAMNTHHVFLSPSVTAQDGDTEGGAPLGIMEASAAGLFVISTQHCDIPHVVTHKKTGLLAPERDYKTLGKYLKWYKKNPDKVSEMLFAARKRMEDDFDAQKQGLALSAIYKKLTV